MTLPKYDGYSLLNVLASVSEHFGISSEYPPLAQELAPNLRNCNKVLLFLVDGMGKNILDKYSSVTPYLNSLAQGGEIKTITSIFPSTTANALTTLHTALATKKHRIIDWYIYLDKTDSIFMPLPFKHVLSEPANNNTFRKFSSDYSQKTIYEKLFEKNIDSTIYYPKVFSGGSYNKIFMKGASINEYIDISDLLSTLVKHINKPCTGKEYIFVYWPFLDMTEHKYGPHSSEVQIHLKQLDGFIYKDFIRKLSSRAKESVGIIMTADHGQISCNPQDTHYLNNYRTLKRCFKKSKNYKNISPIGNKRDLFIHAKNTHKDILLTYLKNKINNAEIVNLDDNTIKELFGTFKEDKQFNSSIGDILILPKKNNLVWYKYYKNDTYTSRGTHGGLSSEEMEIPLVISKLGNIS